MRHALALPLKLLRQLGTCIFMVGLHADLYNMPLEVDARVVKVRFSMSSLGVQRWTADVRLPPCMIYKADAWHTKCLPDSRCTTCYGVSGLLTVTTLHTPMHNTTSINTSGAQGVCGRHVHRSDAGWHLEREFTGHDDAGLAMLTSSIRFSDLATSPSKVCTTPKFVSWRRGANACAPTLHSAPQALRTSRASSIVDFLCQLFFRIDPLAERVVHGRSLLRARGVVTSPRPPARPHRHLLGAIPPCPWESFPAPAERIRGRSRWSASPSKCASASSPSCSAPPPRRLRARARPRCRRRRCGCRGKERARNEHEVGISLA